MRKRRNGKFINEYKIENLFKNGTKSNRSTLKRYLVTNDLLEYKCNICGIDNWNGKYLTLQLDHIDGDEYNNNLKNLRFLCPNCHSQEPTTCIGKKQENKNGWIIKNIEKIIEIIKQKENIHQVLQEFNLSTAGENYKTIERIMIDRKLTFIQKEKNDTQKYCLVCKKSISSKNKFCSKKCSQKIYTRINWNNIDLKKILKDNDFNFTKVSKLLNISRVSVSVRAKKIGII